MGYGMKLDETIIKCFDELLAKADDIGKEKEADGYLNETKYFEWMNSALSLLYRIFKEESLQIRNLNEQYNLSSNNYMIQPDCLKRSKGIVLSAYNDYKNGYLFNIKSLVNAEVLDNVIEQAEELYKAKYKDASCIIAGVTLETTLRKLCENESLAIGKADKMNADLAKAGKYNLFKQKQVTAWLDLRNKAAHGKWEEYKETDVRAMIDGVNNFIADYL